MSYEIMAEQLGISHMRRAGNQVYARCPLHQDRSPSFSLNIETGAWTCHYGCGPDNLRDFPRLVQLVLGMTRTEAEMWVAKRRLEPTNDQLRERINELLAGPVAPEAISADYLEYYHSLNPKMMPVEFLRRGFTWDTIDAWGIRYDDLREQVVIPVVDESGRFRGLVSRLMNPKPNQGKYQNSPGLQKSHILFGLTPQPIGAAIIVTEGPLDAIWMWQNKLPAVATFGDTISDEQTALLRKVGYSEIILALDNPQVDMAAAKALPRNKAKLYAAGWLMTQVKAIVYPERDARKPSGYKDPNDCTPEQLALAVERRYTLI